VRVKVDLGLCQGHAMCEQEAAEVFRVVDRPGDYAQVEVILVEPPEELREKVEAAVRYCPNRVISIVEDGP
jgi:ferredoxin